MNANYIYPFVKCMDPRIQIRIDTKMSWIRNTAKLITGTYKIMIEMNAN
jgi:hypothetical protein